VAIATARARINRDLATAHSQAMAEFRRQLRQGRDGS
jgi:hypothetical protein